MTIQLPAGAIDVHTHFVPHGWPSLGRGRPWLREDDARTAMIMVGDSEFRKIGAECWDCDARLAKMDADGIGAQVVSPTPVFFGYDDDPTGAAKAARIFNDLCLQLCAGAPDRLLPFCQVPLQDPEEACRELDRAIAAGHLGVEIGNHVGDLDLDSNGVVEFLQHAANSGVPVLVHPWDMPDSPRLGRWMARWITGMPAETHLSLMAMILGGVFDRLPRSLRICFAHGGGSFAFWLGRFENAWHQRNDLLGTSEFPPSHYVDRFSVDSVVFSQVALRVLTEVLGVDQVMLGSDFPYPLGERPVGRVLDEAAFLADGDRERIRRGNAIRFLGLDGRGPAR